MTACINKIPAIRMNKTKCHSIKFDSGINYYTMSEVLAFLNLSILFA